jgi:hypothetical protein
MPAGESRDESRPDFVENAGVFVSEAYDRIAQLLSKLLWRIFTPSRWLLQKLEKSESELWERLQSASRLTWLSWWIAAQLVRLVSLIVYWASVGPIYIVVLIACAFLFWAALKPFFFSEWVGALWFGAVLLWLLSRKGSRFWRSFSNIAGAVAIGVTPQFLFLCAYNCFIDGEMTPPHVLQEAIKALRACRSLDVSGARTGERDRVVLVGVGSAWPSFSNLCLREPQTLCGHLVAERAFGVSRFCGGDSNVVLVVLFYPCLELRPGHEP